MALFLCQGSQVSPSSTLYQSLITTYLATREQLIGIDWRARLPKMRPKHRISMATIQIDYLSYSDGNNELCRISPGVDGRFKLRSIGDAIVSSGDFESIQAAKAEVERTIGSHGKWETHDYAIRQA